MRGVKHPPPSFSIPLVFLSLQEEEKKEKEKERGRTARRPQQKNELFLQRKLFSLWREKHLFFSPSVFLSLSPHRVLGAERAYKHQRETKKKQKGNRQIMMVMVLRRGKKNGEEKNKIQTD